MATSKSSLKSISTMILYRMQPKFAVGCKWNAIFESNLEICIDWVRFNFDSIFFKQSDDSESEFLILKIIINFVTDQPFITSFLNLKFSVLTFLRFMTCSMRIEQKMCKENIFQLQSMLNHQQLERGKMCQWKVWGHKFWCALSDFEIWLKQSEKWESNEN